VVTDYLLEREAKKESVTVEELLKRHVGSVSEKSISEDALRVYYDGLDVPEPFEAVHDKIIEVIHQRRAAKARAAYIQSLRSKATVEFRLAPPRGMIVADNVVFRGSRGALVKLVEYADYECPYCQQIQPAIAKLEEEYKGKIEFGFKDAPLPQHANAQKAAEASRCAAAQGKFWEYHDLLFETKQLAVPMLKSHAETLKLDVAAFNKCLDTGATADVVKAQLAEATGLGLPGTPGFFVNGRFITGAIDYGTLRRVVDEELKIASGRSHTTASTGGQP
jgi:protein-disulfide isomerase